MKFIKFKHYYGTGGAARNISSIIGVDWYEGKGNFGSTYGGDNQRPYIWVQMSTSDSDIHLYFDTNKQASDEFDRILNEIDGDEAP